MSDTGAVPRGGPPSAALRDQVERWAQAGGTWEWRRVGTSGVEVLLRRCDGGEVADRLTSTDPGAAAALAALADQGG